jgi:hypothetical protein
MRAVAGNGVDRIAVADKDCRQHVGHCSARPFYMSVEHLGKRFKWPTVLTFVATCAVVAQDQHSMVALVQPRQVYPRIADQVAAPARTSESVESQNKVFTDRQR